jgi:hypothetical protein
MDKVQQYRSEVIERFINLDCIVNAIISQHYFKRVYEPFYLEVLYDENFSFALKRNILTKIVEEFDKGILEKLHRLNTIRNYFAHCGVEFIDMKSDAHRSKIIDPKKIDSQINFDELYKEFNDKATSVEEYLFSIYENKGGQFSTKI